MYLRRLRTIAAWLSVLACTTPAALFAAELPSLTVELTTGKKFRAQLDPRTDTERLWLRFGTGQISVQRSFEWHSVATAHEDGRTLLPEQLVGLATAAREPRATNKLTRIVVRSSESPSDRPRQSTQRGFESPRRVTSVTFDAVLSNWDADVFMDGLVLDLTAIDSAGETATVQGMLTAELYSMRRVDQDSFAHGRGREIRLLERWTTFVPAGSKSVRLPFQSIHPEMAMDWAPFGLVHIQFVVAGHGVFHESIDGLRIRPWAPLRDALERQTGARFFPAEIQ